ncbi:MAG: hypothetical protein WAV41_03240 [Microgenomates group bacterium]
MKSIVFVRSEVERSIRPDMEARGRVTPIWNGATGRVEALEVTKEATAGEVMSVLNENDERKPTTAILGMEFDKKNHKQRFLIRETNFEGMTHLIPWSEEVDKCVEILALDPAGGSEAVLNIKPGITDRVLIEACNGLFGGQIEGISQAKGMDVMHNSVVTVRLDETRRGITVQRLR